MAPLGRYQVGDSIPIELQCMNTGGGPEMPTGCPLADVYAAGGGTAMATAIEIAVHDRYAQDAAGADNAYFQRSYLLDSRFSPGRYVLHKHYNGGARAEVDHFDVVTGGSEVGRIVEMHAFAKPDSLDVVYMTESGDVLAGRNPR